MKKSRSATSLAKPISWVTTIMVIPERANDFMTSSTSLIISGSRAEVGSSNSMIRGSIAKALAIATRCCCPPDSWPGYLWACSGMPTRSSRDMAWDSASARGFFRTQMGARVTLSRMVRCGKRLNCWNTIPTSDRTFSMFRRSLVSSTSSTTIRPSWWISRRLMHRIHVDFPEPEGPSTTTTSCSLMVADTLSRAWKSPYHFDTSSHTIMSRAPDRSRVWPPVGSAAVASVMTSPRRPPGDR